MNYTLLKIDWWKYERRLHVLRINVMKQKRSAGHSKTESEQDVGSIRTFPEEQRPARGTDSNEVYIRQLDTGARESSIFSRCYFGAKKTRLLGTFRPVRVLAVREPRTI